MSHIVRVGVDLAKRVIRVHAVDAAGNVVTSRALPRNKFVAWCAQLDRAAPWPLRPEAIRTIGRASFKAWDWRPG